MLVIGQQSWYWGRKVGTGGARLMLRSKVGTLEARLVLREQGWSGEQGLYSGSIACTGGASFVRGE